MSRILFLILLFLFSINSSYAEKIENDFGYWNKANILVPLNDRFKLNLDTQYRYQKDELQNVFLLSPSLGIDLPKGFSFWNGYTYYNYGDGSTLSEHRVWQQLQHEKNFSKASLINRFRLEERFFGGTGLDDLSETFSLRGRYLMRGMIPVSKNKKWSLVLSDEILFNFNNALFGLVNDGYEGNRLFAGINHKFNDYINAELGYQLQHHNLGTAKVLFFSFDPPQILNHGVLFNAYITLPQLSNKNKKSINTQPAF